MSTSTPAPVLPASVQGLVARLIRVFAPEQVLLFGSYARREATSRSDVDLLVVVSCEDDALELARRRQQLVGACFPRVDLVPATAQELREACGERAVFLRGVLQHGIPLHPPPA